MRVVIAEDEIFERKAMKKFLEESFPHLQVVGEAVNGRKAIQLADELLPDFIIMDIKMPGVDGLKAIEAILKTHPNMKFIIASAYDSFEYAKQAMKMGVKEYILKPSKKDETIQAIVRVQKEITREQEQAKKDGETKELAKHHFLLKVMQHEIDEEVKALKKDLYPSIKSACFFNIEPVTEEIIQEVDFFLHQHSPHTYITQKQNDQYVVFFLSGEKEIKSTMLTFARKLHLALEKSVYIGIGNPYTQLKDFPTSFYEATKAVRQLAASKQANYGFYTEETDSDVDVEEQFLQEIQAGNEKGAEQAFRKVKRKDIDLQELFFKVKQLLESMQIETRSLKLADYESEAEWIRFIPFCCVEIQQVYQSRKYIERAKRYILERYDQQITLEEVAQYVDLSPNYFSLLFKEKTSKTFIDFLTEARLDRAKQLLEENELSLKEICYQIGYKDPNYFSRVFKKHFHVSPKQFQKQILKM